MALTNTPGRHRELDRITTFHNGIHVNILLNEISIPEEPKTYYSLSWRTRYRRGGANRRFYYTNRDGYWRIPVLTALELLETAERRGFLHPRYDDPQIRHQGTNNKIIDPRHYDGNAREYGRVFAEIADGGEDWGKHPTFVIVEVPDRTWRKIMIVDSAKEVCTFRSTTQDSEYNLLTRRPHLAPPWIMDNSMQDASVAMMRQFLQVLRTL